MLQRAQQLALSRGASAASTIAAYEALSTLDPLLRLVTKRRIRRLLQRAEREAPGHDIGHHLRLAYLLGAGAQVSDPENAPAVAEAALALAAPGSAGARGPWLVAVLAACLLLAAGGVLWLRHASRPFSPLQTPAGRLLGTTLAEYAIASSRGDEPGRRAAAEALTGPAATQALGAEAVRRVQDLLASAHALSSSTPEEQPARVDAFQNAATGLDRALMARGLPYFVDAEIYESAGARPLTMSYYVQRESWASAEGKLHRVVRLWRIDGLGVAQGALGFTRPHTPAAIVLLDQVEADLIRYTLPAAAPLGQVELTDEETRAKGEPWLLELEERATKAVGAHYRSLPAPLGTDAIRIGTLLSRRRELVRKWARLLRGQGFELAQPRGLLPGADYTKELELRVPRADLDAWQELHDELRERLPSFEALRDRFAQGVERHEVQHRIDYARGLMPVPRFLCDVLGIENPLDAPYGTLGARARDEASAYLAELARPGESALNDLVILAHFMLDRRELGSPYAYAALEVYVALGRALGIDVDALLGRSISRERAARLAEAVWERSPDELRGAARKAYEAELGVPLPDVVFSKTRDERRYRPER